MLAMLYRESVLGLGPLAYDARQVAAWARFPENLSEFRDQLRAGVTLLAELGSETVAFGQLHPSNHIALIYTRPAFARQGYARQIYSELELTARGGGVEVLETEASRIARPFFEHCGFVVAEIEHPVRHGVYFERFKMHKRLA